ncbi:hypothetical protein E5K00_06145 [Hymenobacter aquaticus]|uniref:Uncharacterized protein n=1 Tax=Hymenobacter aquaticus TaxID=1867101 RepID=A0A4Z0Q6L5_9BACT|nr:hypothetical protein [Hymenobacter aquaticus]TGE24783.1 hypothetical protein E5K00_06145 [Hymenobacter aquaticus]
MKYLLFFRLGLLTILLVAGVSLRATAQTRVYTEDADQPGLGYWTIETDPAHRDYSVVRFYTPEHEKIYEERLDGLCLDPSRGTTACRRTARMLSASIVNVRRERAASMVANGLGMYRKVPRTYALR